MRYGELKNIWIVRSRSCVSHIVLTDEDRNKCLVDNIKKAYFSPCRAQLILQLQVQHVVSARSFVFYLLAHVVLKRNTAKNQKLWFAVEFTITMRCSTQANEHEPAPTVALDAPQLLAEPLSKINGVCTPIAMAVFTRALQRTDAHVVPVRIYIYIRTQRVRYVAVLYASIFDVHLHMGFCFDAHVCDLCADVVVRVGSLSQVRVGCGATGAAVSVDAHAADSGSPSWCAGGGAVGWATVGAISAA